MTTKSTKYNKSGISKLPDNKPVVYKIQSENGNNNYTGIAKKFMGSGLTIDKM